MSRKQLVTITSGMTDFPEENTVPILQLAEPDARRNWTTRLIRAKIPFAIASANHLQAEEILRLAETSKRRKLPVAILHSYRLMPVFARMKELLVSGCLGAMPVVRVRFPQDANAIFYADIAIWLSQQPSSQYLAQDEAELVVVTADGPNGHAEASCNPLSHESSMTIRLGGSAREIAIPQGDPYLAERDVLACTLPIKHRWPLLMHANDAAEALRNHLRNKERTK